MGAAASPADAIRAHRRSLTSSPYAGVPDGWTAVPRAASPYDRAVKASRPLAIVVTVLVIAALVLGPLLDVIASIHL